MTNYRIAVLEARVKMLEEVVEKLVAKTQDVTKAEEGFKVGDRVRIKVPLTRWEGMIGTIARESNAEPYNWRVEFGHGFSSIFKESELEHA